MLKSLCCYGDCKNPGFIEFALVPLCSIHYTMIIEETVMYYEETIKYKDRNHYHMISWMISWRNTGKYRMRNSGRG